LWPKDFFSEVIVYEWCPVSEASLPVVEISLQQSELWSQILASTLAMQSDRLVFVSEYLGYLPFGLYQWLECAGQTISSEWSIAWQRSDIVALEAAGGLVLVEAWQNPDDRLEIKTTYEVCRDRDFVVRKCDR
jgi:hypothetical protein